MNAAILMRDFKGMDGITLVISGDRQALFTLLTQLEKLGSHTGAFSLIIGDGKPFLCRGGMVSFDYQDSMAGREFFLREDGIYCLRLDQSTLVELTGKLRGILELSRPSHNYVEVNSGGLERIMVTLGEYSESLIRKMMKDSIEYL